METEIRLKLYIKTQLVNSSDISLTLPPTTEITKPAISHFNWSPLMLHVCECVCVFTCGSAHICVRYPSVCPVMKAVSMRTNPTISTSRLNDRDIFTLSLAEGRGKRKSEREEGSQH